MRNRIWSEGRDESELSPLVRVEEEEEGEDEVLKGELHGPGWQAEGGPQ